MRPIASALLLSALVAPLSAAETGALRVDIWDAATNTRIYASGGSAVDDGSQTSLDLIRVSSTWVFYDDLVFVTAGPGTGYWFTAYAPDYIPQTFTGVQIYNSSTTKFVVYLVRPVLSLSFSSSSVVEGGTCTGTVTLRNAAGAAVALRNSVTVNLVSGSARATVPASVTIPALATSATFTVTAVDNGSDDGDAAVTVTATRGTWGNTAGTVTVVDND